MFLSGDYIYSMLFVQKIERSKILHVQVDSHCRSVRKPDVLMRMLYFQIAVKKLVAEAECC